MDKPNPDFFLNFVKLLGEVHPQHLNSETNFLDPLAPTHTHQSPCCLQCLGDCDVGTLIYAKNSTSCSFLHQTAPRSGGGG